MDFTEVEDRKKGTTITYSLNPNAALVAAFEQFERRNFNTWDYPLSKAVHMIERIGNKLMCTDRFYVLMEN